MSNGLGHVKGHIPDRPTAEDTTKDVDYSKIIERMDALLSAEIARAEKIDNYYYGKHPNPYMPKEAGHEYKLLAERSINNVMPLIIHNKEQMLYVEGFMSSDSTELAKAWDTWQYNRMDSRQVALYHTVLKYGVAYTTILPGEGKHPIIKSYSPRNMIAAYEDPANDEWPVYALEVLDWYRDGERRYRLYDSTHVHTLSVHTGTPYRVDVMESEAHGSPYCPVVRWTYNLDLEGRYQGEIEPLMTAQDRLNQTSMDRLLVQTFASWKVRTVSGMILSADDREAYEQKLKVAKDRILVAQDPDTRFGSLPETPLTGFIQATRADNEAIAAIAAVPPHYLSGELNNLGAEAIAEARAALDANVEQIKHSLGEDVEQCMRAISLLIGDTAGAEDYTAQVFWRDMQSRSLASTADALGKIATMLGVPEEALWDRLPGVTSSDVERWKLLKQEKQNELAEQWELMGGENANTSTTNPQSPTGSQQPNEQRGSETASDSRSG